MKRVFSYLFALLFLFISIPVIFFNVYRCVWVWDLKPLMKFLYYANDEIEEMTK